MEKMIFAKEINRLNMILNQSAMIMGSDMLDVYYEALSKYNGEIFSKAISYLIETWENPHFRPTPANFINAIEKMEFDGLSEEEFVAVASAYKIIGEKPKNKYIESLIKRTDKKSLSNGFLLLENKENFS